MEKLVQTIKKIARKNPEGFTVDLKANPVKASGFVISIPETQNSHTDEQLRAVVKTAIKNDCYIGGWMDRETGRFHYDASIIVQDRRKALDLAKKYGQIAIFDLNTMTEIRL